MQSLHLSTFYPNHSLTGPTPQGVSYSTPKNRPTGRGRTHHASPPVRKPPTLRRNQNRHFPSFLEGLSLRCRRRCQGYPRQPDFHTVFWLSLRPPPGMSLVGSWVNFPSFWEGLSLRQHGHSWLEEDEGNFPSLLERLSLRCSAGCVADGHPAVFPFLLGGAFIEVRLRRGFL